MKRLFTSIIAALRAVLGALWAFALLPGHLIGALFGVAPDHDEIPPIASAEDLDKVAAAEIGSPDPGNVRAAHVLEWCAQSIMDNRPASLPFDLPTEISQWLRGLTRQECAIIVHSEEAGIENHLRAHRRLSGVRAVRPLMPEPWIAGPDTGPAVDIIADEEFPEPAPPSARP